MTIYTPRVGFEVLSATATGTDRASATAVPLALGRSALLLSGTGGVVLSGEAGAELLVPVPSNPIAGIRLYLPLGDSVYGTGGSTTDFTLGAYALNLGNVVQLVKISATEWIVWS